MTQVLPRQGVKAYRQKVDDIANISAPLESEERGSTSNRSNQQLSVRPNLSYDAPKMDTGNASVPPVSTRSQERRTKDDGARPSRGGASSLADPVQSSRIHEQAHSRATEQRRKRPSDACAELLKHDIDPADVSRSILDDLKGHAHFSSSLFSMLLPHGILQLKASFSRFLRQALSGVSWTDRGRCFSQISPPLLSAASSPTSPALPPEEVPGPIVLAMLPLRHVRY